MFCDAPYILLVYDNLMYKNMEFKGEKGKKLAVVKNATRPSKSVVFADIFGIHYGQYVYNDVKRKKQSI